MSTEIDDSVPEKVTLLEALASDIAATGINDSNISTPTAGDADDQ